MKLLRAALLAFVALCATAGLRAQVTAIFNTSGFTSGATVIDFNSLVNEVAITNQFAGQGVTFSGGLVALTNGGDTNQFPSNGGGVIASDWRYSSNLQALPITATFTSAQVQLGFLTEMNSGSVIQITTLLNGTSHGTVIYTSVGLSAVFFGVKDDLGFNSVSINVINSNRFLAFDDFRFQAVPEPSTYALLGAGLGLTALLSLRRRAAGA